MSGIGAIAMVAAMAIGLLIGRIKWIGGKSSHRPKEIKVSCPVCRTEVKASSSTAQATFQGKTFYFASEEHEMLFLKNPQMYKTEKP